MGTRCQICLSPKRLEIDRQLVQGRSLASVARFFGVSYNSLYIHSHHHISRQLATSYEMVAMRSDIDLLGTIDDVLKKTQTIFDRNYQKGNDLTALKALDGVRSTIGLLAQISQQLHASKMAEEDRLRDEQEQKAKKEETFKDRLSVLTFEEACTLQRLIAKVHHGNGDEIIVDGRITAHWLSRDKYEQ
jgi:hypothetical protein